MSSFLNSYKIGIISDAHALSTEAANALLKTLEEPKDKVVVILVTSDIGSLPETIVSRSRVLRFYPVATDTIYRYLAEERGVSRGAAKDLAHLAAGRPALAVKFLEDRLYHENYLKRAAIFLDFFSSDLNGRFSAIEEMLGKKAKGPQSVRSAREIIGVWQGVARDLLLMELDESDLVRNEAIRREIGEMRGKYKPMQIMKILRSLSLAEKYVAANVNPKLALEQVAVGM